MTVEVTSEEQRKKRNKRGRPAKDESMEYETVWSFDLTYKRDEGAIDAARKRASCSVLVTD